MMPTTRSFISDSDGRRPLKVMKRSVQITYFIIMFVMIIIPVALYSVIGDKIDTGTEDKENRVLAEKPSLEYTPIIDYPSAFDAYFEDHLPFKDPLVELNNYLNYEALGTSSSDDVVAGKDGWLFYIGSKSYLENPIKDYNGENLYTEEQLEQLKANMMGFRDALAEKDCKFVIALAPNKERVYSDYMPYLCGPPAENDRLTQVAEYLRANTDIPVVLMYDDLAAYKESHPDEDIYYRYDTHWNDKGAYIGARALERELGNEMPEADTLTMGPGDPVASDLARFVNLSDLLKDKTFTMHGYADPEVEVEHDKGGGNFWGVNEAGNGDDRKLFVIGDSYSTIFYRYLAGCHNDSRLMVYYIYKRETLDEFDPDIVVLEFVERYVDNMLYFTIDGGFDPPPDPAGQ